MHKLCKYIDRELEEYENKVANGGKLSRTEIEDGKNLAKFKSALLTNEAMESEGYSNDMSYPHTQSGARNRKRDSMGRYSEYGYSRANAEEGFMAYLEDAMESAPDEHKRRKVERLINEMR